MTSLKLIRSLASVRATSVPRCTIRAPVPSRATSDTPTRAPRVLAPVSPSIARSPRSSGSAAAAAPTAAATGTPRRPQASGRCASTTFPARPGRRSNRFTTFACPAIAAPPASTPTSRVTRPARLVVVVGGHAAADSSPARPMPAILTAPVVSSPRDSDPRCPRRPLLWPDPHRSSSRPRAIAPMPATAAGMRMAWWSLRAVSSTEPTAPAAVAGPAASVTCAPWWLVRCHLSGPPRPPRVMTWSSTRRPTTVAPAASTAAQALRSPRMASPSVVAGTISAGLRVPCRLPVIGVPIGCRGNLRHGGVDIRTDSVGTLPAGALLHHRVHHGDPSARRGGNVDGGRVLPQLVVGPDRGQHAGLGRGGRPSGEHRSGADLPEGTGETRLDGSRLLRALLGQLAGDEHHLGRGVAGFPVHGQQSLLLVGADRLGVHGLPAVRLIGEQRIGQHHRASPIAVRVGIEQVLVAHVLCREILEHAFGVARGPALVDLDAVLGVGARGRELVTEDRKSVV